MLRMCVSTVFGLRKSVAGDLGVGLAVDDQTRDLELARRQRRPRRPPRRCPAACAGGCGGRAGAARAPPRRGRARRRSVERRCRALELARPRGRVSPARPARGRRARARARPRPAAPTACGVGRRGERAARPPCGVAASSRTAARGAGGHRAGHAERHRRGAAPRRTRPRARPPSWRPSASQQRVSSSRHLARQPPGMSSELVASGRAARAPRRRARGSPAASSAPASATAA